MFILLWALASCVSTLAVTVEHYELDNAATYFEDFINKFEKHYADEHEKSTRFEIFKDNLEYINRLNKESERAVYVITPFADLTPDEFTRNHTGLKHKSLEDDNLFCKILYDENIPDAGAPESLDWRQYNIVTQVKDQGNYGTCWTFSATGHLEGQVARKYQTLLELSEQQIIDCNPNTQFNGGYPSAAFKEIMNIGGLVQEADYPYKGEVGTCRQDGSKVAVKVADCFSYNLTSQEKVKQLLYTTGPISIGIRAQTLQYHGGEIIYDNECNAGKVNHAVLLVGYGTENGMPYWLIKNSWGLNHGDNGYYRIQRSDNPNGACGMLNMIMATAVIQ